MFIRSNMEISVFYNKGEHSIELKPQTITYVDDNIVTQQELINCYGDRITLIAEEIVKEIMDEGATPAEANTGDKEVDAFLNGETDKTPEGTEEITEEEAKKLAEEKAAAEAAKKLAEEEAKKLAEEEKAKKEAEEKAAKKLAEETKNNKKDVGKEKTKSTTKSTKTGKNK